MDISVKANQLSDSDLTELSKEWVIARDGNPSFKSITLIINLIHGKAHVKYALYKRRNHVMTSPDLPTIIARYNTIKQEKRMVTN